MAVLRNLCLLALLASSAIGETKPTNAVKRVTNLLQEMKAQLEAEAKADNELYDKMVCWCETNDKEKTKAIADEEQAIIDLGNAINANVAKEATLNAEITALNKGIGENTEALAKATDMRAKEENEFIASEKEATMSISATKNALKMLEKQNSLSQTNLLQLTKIAIQSPRTSKFLAGVSPSHLQAVMAFVQSQKHGLSFLQQAPSGGSYAPQSGAIFGILQ